uniref:Fe2OG dioxygenase domain-containing protein n=1 Tax=viral metagenome TaxID=1070528 RepID=A0A6C0ECG9_9ZZZZ
MSDDEIIITNKKCNNALFYLPKMKSNFDLVSNLNFDIKDVLYKGCIYLPNLICDKDDMALFNKLNNELINDYDKISDWSQHHKIDNPTDSKTFNNIVKCLENYFKINVLASRLNYYTQHDYKPFHHDSHAYSNGLKEDTTIGLSLGGSRSLAFKHVESGQMFYFPQHNGDIFCFDHLTNQKFMHGIPKLKNTDIENLRLSIIIWGKKL